MKGKAHLPGGFDALPPAPLREFFSTEQRKKGRELRDKFM